MRKTLIGLAVAGVVALGTTTAVGVAASSEAGARTMHEQMSAAMPMDMASMDMASMDMTAMAAMHDESMEAMHEQMRDAMPPELREACDDAHASRGAGMSPADHDAHHAEG